MKILKFTAQNFMRLTVVQITPEGNLIEITGANGNGKTSVLTAVWVALGGADAMPEMPIREGQKTAKIEVKLGDAAGTKYIVTRTFTEKGSYLKITTPDGATLQSPQTIMAKLMGKIGFDPLAFMTMDEDKRFALLRSLVKIDVDITKLDQERQGRYDTRTGTNRAKASARARADAIAVPADLPDEKPDVAGITARLTSASSHNMRVRDMINAEDAAASMLKHWTGEVARLEEEFAEAKDRLQKADEALDALKKIEIPQPIDGEAVQRELMAANLTMEGFRRQAEKIAAEAEFTKLEREATEHSDRIDAIDAEKAAAIASAKMPVEGLGFDGEHSRVLYNGIPFSQASDAEKLRVSAAIGAACNPDLRVLLCRNGSLLDRKAMKALADFATAADMQIFLERMDESGEVGIVMEDGHVKGQEAMVEAAAKATEAEKSVSEATPTEPDGDRLARAKAYLAGIVVSLNAATEQRRADEYNAEVKVKLAAFPSLLREWAGHYLAKSKAFKK